MKCFKSLMGVSRMDGVRNEDVCISAGTERELVSNVHPRVEMIWTHGENG